MPDGIGLFLVDAGADGLARRGYTLRDETRAAEVSLTNVAVPDSAVLGEPGAGFATIERVVEAGIAAMGAEAVGAMETMQSMTLEYSRTREQFGKPIGTNQVVQHRLSETLMALEQGRSMAMLATVSVEDPDAAERARNISMAKVGYGQAARFVSQQAIQLHGGIGMTEEYAVGHYFRRCDGDRAQFRRHRLPPGAAGGADRMTRFLSVAGEARPGGAAPWTPAKGSALGTHPLVPCRWGVARRARGRVGGRETGRFCAQSPGRPPGPAPAAPPPTGTEPPEGSRGLVPWQGVQGGSAPLALLQTASPSRAAPAVR